MNKRDFVNQRRPEWTQFQRMVDRLESRASGRMKGMNVLMFSQRFRELAHDLALVRSRGWGEDLETYLNDLSARGHNVFYRTPPGRMGRFMQFLSYGYPQLFRQNIAYFWAAAACLFLPLFIAWGVVQQNPDAAHRVMGPDLLQHMEDQYRNKNETRVEEIGFAENRAQMGGYYIYHNVGIALRAFAAGLLFGVVTIYVLLSNGIMIGTVTGYLISQGRGDAFLSFVISHGAFELTAIAIAGGAGLMLGNAVMHPGQRTRMESLQVKGREAVQIASGAVVMLFIAALIEAFWSPAPIPASIKYTVGGVMWLLVALYLTIVGREVVYGTEVLLEESPVVAPATTSEIVSEENHS